MRVIVTGGRDWANSDAICGALDRLLRRHGNELKVRHGACYPKEDSRGERPLVSADWLAELWCKANGLQSYPVPANWSLGPKGGPMRNEEMARMGADLCLAFWDGKSAGTLDMIRQAVRYGIPVRIVPATSPAEPLLPDARPKPNS